MMKRIIAVLISALMLVAMLPAWCWAEEQKVADSIIEVNPVYEDVVDECDIVDTAEYVSPLLAAGGGFTKCKSIADAGKLIRKAMVARKEVVKLSYSFTSSDYKATMSELDKKFFEEAIKHTGTPNEGEYLRWQYGGYSRYSAGTKTGNSYKMNFTYTISYYTTASEEAEITDEVGSILSSLDLDSQDDYGVVNSIYDYIIRNVSYDSVAVKTLDHKAFTPYKAIVDSRHKAVCQGYSLLLYRMLLECGIDCRMVAADNGSTAVEDGHAWNLIKLGDEYYIADPTWDSNLVHGGDECKYFLCGSKDFMDHQMYTHIYSYIENHETANSKYIVTSEPVVKSWRKTSVTSLKHTKTSFTVKWSKRIGVKGYQIQYGLKKSMSKASIKTVDGSGVTSTKISKLKKGKKYYVRVRTYKVVDGKKYHSKWSSKKSVKLK